jgi:hypothetical protein
MCKILGHDRPEHTHTKNVSQGDVSFYVKNADLISLKQYYNYTEYEGKNDKNRQLQTSAGCAQAYWHQWT